MQFRGEGSFLVVSPVDLASHVPLALVLVVSSDLDAEDMADLAHSRLKENEGLSVLGAGVLDVFSAEEGRIAFHCAPTPPFPAAPPAIVRRIFEETYSNWKIQESGS